MIRALALVSLLALAACGSDPEPPAAPDPAPIAVDTLTAPDTTATPAEPAEDPVLYLAAGGLEESGAAGATEPISFGRPAADAIADVAAIRGAPSDEGTNEECGAGPLGYAQWADGLILYSQDGAFAGWAYNGPAGPDGLATTGGVGIGSPRSALDAAATVDVMESSLGTEFNADGLYGILSGPEADATVDALWAGVSCNFR